MAYGVQLEFLKIVPRFNGSVYDHYYCCNVHGTVSTWHVNGIYAGGFSSTDLAGMVFHTSNDNGTALNVTAILLSSQAMNDTFVLDTVLIVSTPSLRSLQPSVQCRNDTTPQNNSNEPKDITKDLKGSDESEDGNVALEYVLVGNNVITSNSSIDSRFVQCKTRGNTLTWTVNGQFAGGFFYTDKVGRSAVNRVDGIASQISILLTRRLSDQHNTFELTSVLILSDTRSSSNIVVQCSADTMHLPFSLPLAPSPENPPQTSPSPTLIFHVYSGSQIVMLNWIALIVLPIIICD